MLVCGGWLGLCLAASGTEKVLRLPTSGRVGVCRHLAIMNGEFFFSSPCAVFCTSLG